MDNFKDIMAIWHSEKGTNLPSAAQITAVIRAHKQRQSYRFYFIIGGLVLCLVIMLFIIFTYHVTMWTTPVGESLYVLAILYILTIKYRSLRRKKANELLNNQEYLQQLKKEKIQDFTKTPYKLILGFLLLILASCFYFYEWLVATKNTLILGYLCLSGFFLAAWFIYRPYMKRRYWKKNEQFIKKMESLQKQTQ